MTEETNTSSSTATSMPQKQYSLEIGSEGYNQRVRANKGMTGLEQKRDKQGKLDKNFKDVNQETEDYERLIRNMSKMRQQRLAARNYGVLTTAEREIAHQIRKMDNIEKVLGQAKAEAKKTKTLADDEYVADILPGELEKEVYDISVGDDFDTPLGRAFRRFG